MNVTRRWARRIVHTMQIDPLGEPAESTLETFFAGVRWGEDHGTDGRRTLRAPSL